MKINMLQNILKDAWVIKVESIYFSGMVKYISIKSENDFSLELNIDNATAFESQDEAELFVKNFPEKMFPKTLFFDFPKSNGTVYKLFYKKINITYKPTINLIYGH